MRTSPHRPPEGTPLAAAASGAVTPPLLGVPRIARATRTGSPGGHGDPPSTGARSSSTHTGESTSDVPGCADGVRGRARRTGDTTAGALHPTAALTRGGARCAARCLRSGGTRRGGTVEESPESFREALEPSFGDAPAPRAPRGSPLPSQSGAPRGSRRPSPQTAGATDTAASRCASRAVPVTLDRKPWARGEAFSVSQAGSMSQTAMRTSVPDRARGGCGRRSTGS